MLAALRPVFDSYKTSRLNIYKRGPRFSKADGLAPTAVALGSEAWFCNQVLAKLQNGVD